MKDSIKAKTIIIVFIAIAALYALDMGTRSFWAENEAFYALGARSVLHGNFLVPRVNNDEFVDKPPLTFWWVALVSKLFGDVTEVSARLANLIAAMAALIFLFAFVRKWRNAWVALFAVFMLGTTYEFWENVREVNTDILFTAFLTLAWISLFNLFKKEFRWSRWGMLWGSVGLAMLTKGPAALALTVGIAVVFAFVSSGWREGLKSLLKLRPFTGIGLALLPFVIWGALVWWNMGIEPLYFIVIKHNFLRFLDAFSHENPWYYYIHKLPASFLPWSLLLPFLVWSLFRRWKTNRASLKGVETYALCLISVVFIFFSISTSKRDYYLLPLMPWLVVLLADYAANQVTRMAISPVALQGRQMTQVVPSLRQIMHSIYGKVVIIVLVAFVSGLVTFSTLGVTLLDERKSPKPAAKIIKDVVDGNDRLIFVDIEDPRLMYYVARPIHCMDDKAEDLKRLHIMLQEDDEISLVVEDSDMCKFRRYFGSKLYVQTMATFKDDTFMILTNDYRPGLVNLENSNNTCNTSSCSIQ